MKIAPRPVVIAGLGPAIHSVAFGGAVTEWMPGSSPGMTTLGAAALLERRIGIGVDA
jgi:hypothetical protein